MKNIKRSHAGNFTIITDLGLHLSIVLFCAVAAFPAAAQLPEAIDLSVQSATQDEILLRVYGAEDLESLGSGSDAVAFGDMNGDGFDDLVVGARLSSPTIDETAAGEVLVLYGNPKVSGTTIDLSVPPLSHPHTRILGGEPFEQIGQNLASGDVNDDGFDDLLIGSPLAEVGGATQAGKVYVLYGRADLPGSTLTLGGSKDSASRSEILGATGWARTGSSVATGDIDGDGREDVVIGVLRESGGLDSCGVRGRVRVVYGVSLVPGESVVLGQGPGANGDTMILGDDSPTHWTGGGVFGRSVASGDVNGDGYDDIIAGAPMGDGIEDASSDSGEMVVIYGSETLGGVLIDLSDPPGAYGETRIYGDDTHDKLGWFVNACDVNSDGYDDIVGVAPGACYDDPQSGQTLDLGETYVIYGGPSLGGSVINLDTDGEISPAGETRIRGMRSARNSYTTEGQAVMAVSGGDVDGDGGDDLILGIPGGGVFRQNGSAVWSPAGTVGVIGSGGLERAQTVDLSEDGVDALIVGHGSQARFGNSTAAGGDLNRDGLADFAAVAPFSDTPPPIASENNWINRGMASVVLGSGEIGVATRTAFSRKGDAPPADFGPVVRCRVDYLSGDSVSGTTVSLRRTGPAESPVLGLFAVPLRWEITTDRTSFAATVTFRFSDRDIAGASEENLKVYGSPDGTPGTWTVAGSGQTVDSDRNEIVVEGLTGFSVYAILDDSTGEVPTPTQTLTITNTPTRTPTFTLTPSLTWTPSHTPTSQPTLPESQIVEISSPNEEFAGEFGCSVSGIPDVNGDGFGDIVVGARMESEGGVRVGRAYAIDGAARTVLHALISPNAQEGGNFGASVAGVPDVNGDGRGDFVVGAKSETVGDTTGAGRTYVFDGATGQLHKTLVSPNAVKNGQFGCSVAGMPDANGDGLGEILVGAVLEDAGDDLNNAGRAYIFDGSTGQVLHVLESLHAINGGQFGNEVAGVADADGDGFGDAIIGAWKEMLAYVFNGATGEFVSYSLSCNEYGNAVSGIPDLNGDGLGDAIVGAKMKGADGFNRAGRVRTVDGTRGSEIRWLQSPNPELFGHFGNAVAGFPDVNGNGHPDLLVGAFQEDPGSSPSNSGRVYLLDGVTNEVLRTFASPNEEAVGLFGTDVSGMPDANGDGFGEVLVSAPYEDPGDSPDEAGRVYLFLSPFGSAEVPTPTPSPTSSYTHTPTLDSTRTPTPQPTHSESQIVEFSSPNEELSGEFGCSLSGIPDISGDGSGDLIIGARKEGLGENLSGAGRVYVMDGASKTVLHSFVSPNTQDGGNFGVSVAGIPDVNGDGCLDLIVGANLEDVEGVTDAGRVYIFDGSSGVLLRSLVSPNPKEHGSFGISVSGVADVNGNGTGDVAVGAYLESQDPSPAFAGRAYVFDGSTGELIHRLQSSQEEGGGQFGYSVCGLADRNGDGRGEILVGAWHELQGCRRKSGRAYLFDGATGALVGILRGRSNGEFGISMSSIPQHSDGARGYVVVGSWRENTSGIEKVGHAYLFGDANPNYTHQLESPNNELDGHFGNSVSGVPDVNGNSTGDVIVGAHLEDPGESPGNCGRAYIFDGDSGDLIYTLSSPHEEPLGEFGTSVAGIPDVNGDGLGDVAVTAIKEDPGESPFDSGRVYLFLSPFGVVEVPTPTPTGGDPPVSTPTPTEPLCDSGYYLLDSFGGRHRVGNPVAISGSLYFGTDIVRDMERAVCTIGEATQDDLIVLDGYGAAHSVVGLECRIPQDFYFGGVSKNEFPEGRAVDIEVAVGSQGFWVLTDYGAIYRAGASRPVGEPSLVPNTDRTGTLGFDVPIPSEIRPPGAGGSDGASLRAVSLAAIDENRDSLADGYLVLDSMGGHYQHSPAGTFVTPGSSCSCEPNDPERLLDPIAYIWPFFKGLDIARDMELHPTQQGVVILDGWDGIHPVPVHNEDNPVYFANNRVSNVDDTPVQTVGMPYVIKGYNDPATETIDESNTEDYGIDSESIFTDLEFSAGCGDGLYTLDKFGGVFVLGAAREVEGEPIPQFGNSPYFFPFLYAEDLEVFAGDETEYEEETGFVTTSVEMVTIPAGSFMMGNTGTERDQICDCPDCDCEEPRHEVAINYSFQMGKYEVTNAEYADVLNWVLSNRDYLSEYSGGSLSYNGQMLLDIGSIDCSVKYGGDRFVVVDRNLESQEDYPVVMVTWYGVIAFCNWLSEKDGLPPCYNLDTWTLPHRQGGGYRLPSESEWEYACRGPASNPNRYSVFSFGDDPSLDLSSCQPSSVLYPYMAWCGRYEGTVEVWQRSDQNAWGVHFMHGNVWEFCQDWFHSSYGDSGRPDDGSPWGPGEFPTRVLRGGSAVSAPRYCRSSFRGYGHMDRAGRRVGFRIARALWSD